MSRSVSAILFNLVVIVSLVIAPLSLMVDLPQPDAVTTQVARPAQASSQPADAAPGLSAIQPKQSPPAIQSSSKPQLITTQPATVSNADAPQAAASSPFNSAYVRDVDLGNGKHEAVVSSTPVNYQASDGSWQPIDPRFEAVRGGFINQRNSLEISVGSQQATVRVRSGDNLVGWEPRALVLTSLDGTETVLAQTLGTAQAMTGTLSDDGRTIRYPNNWTLADLSEEVTAGPGQVEQSLIVAQRPTAIPLSGGGLGGGSLTLRATLYLLPGEQLYADGTTQTTAFTTDKSLEIRDAKGKTVLVLPAARAFEKNNPRASVMARYRLTPQGQGEWQVSLETPWSWWADSARVYPVVLDPVMQALQAISTATVINSPPNCSVLVLPGTDNSAWIGEWSGSCGPARSLVRFDNLATLTFPPGYSIQKAELLAVPTSGYFPSIANTPYFATAEVEVHAITTSWNPATVQWGAYSTDATPLPPDLTCVQDHNAACMTVNPLVLTEPNPLYDGSKWILQNGATGLVSNWLAGVNNNGVELQSTSPCSTTRRKYQRIRDRGSSVGSAARIDA